jgi:hypothetical protein
MMRVDNGSDEAKARFAIINNETSIDRVRAYLPSNYSARLSQWKDQGTLILIEGVDNAGWTLDGYVIPRLGSGLIFATEVSFDDEAEAEAAEAEAKAVVTDDETTTSVLTTEQSDAVDMLRGRINSALVGFDADSRLTILETVRAVLNQMIDDVITELVGDDETDDDAVTDDETDDEYESVSLCPACGEPSDYCQGHGELGDPSGFAILAAHDNGDHSQCVEEADCLGLAD